nr:50S ribosomal protein L4P [uncultured archaeon]
MKAKILDINGKEKGNIELPKFFSEKIRGDIVAKVLESKKSKQPYSPSLVAGKQHSAKGKQRRRRHVWRSSYGRGSSRVPRTIFSQKGSSFNWEAAEVPFARGGMRAHPPKVLSMMTRNRINKKEMILALKSTLAATADKKIVAKKYMRVEEKDIRELPLIVEEKIISLKTKELISSLKKILGEKLFVVSLKDRSVRSGKGKLRGRKYKKTAGLLFVVGENEKLKTKLLDFANVKNLSVLDLAKGSMGRLVIYTESAIKNLGEKLK